MVSDLINTGISFRNYPASSLKSVSAHVYGQMFCSYLLPLLTSLLSANICSVVSGHLTLSFSTLMAFQMFVLLKFIKGTAMANHIILPVFPAVDLISHLQGNGLEAKHFDVVS